MKKIRNNTVKILVMIALFCSVSFADGDMGGGGLADGGDSGKTGKTVITITPEDDGDMGGGGKLFDSGSFQSVIDSVYDYFVRMM